MKKTIAQHAACLFKGESILISAIVAIAKKTKRPGLTELHYKKLPKGELCSKQW